MQQQLNKVKKTTFVQRALDFGIEVCFYIPFTFLLNEVNYEYITITNSIIKYIKYLRLWHDTQESD